MRCIFLRFGVVFRQLFSDKDSKYCILGGLYESRSKLSILGKREDFKTNAEILHSLRTFTTCQRPV